MLAWLAARVPVRLISYDNGVVMFVADDLAAWLIGLLADAGRKKLTALALGADQDRELRQAATAAVRRTAEDLHPAGSEQAGRVALVISQVFGESVPDVPLAGHKTVLGALQVGIATQLAVLDDASLTGTGQSSADVLGTPGMVLAEMLTGHLLDEIVARGARGGPLFPLATQLNHDLSRLDSEELKRMVGAALDALARLEGAGDRSRYLVGVMPPAAECFQDRDQVRQLREPRTDQDGRALLYAHRGNKRLCLRQTGP